VRDGTSSRLLVCDNDGHVVTSHQVESGPAGVVVAEPEVLIGAGLDIPDGVARSADGRWLAVSNHHTNSVLVFDTTTLEPEGRPACVLRGVRYPHGLRFVDDGRAL